MSPLFLKRADLIKSIGISYPTILKMEKAGTFPARRSLTEGRVGWLYSEVETWANNCLTV